MAGQPPSGPSSSVADSSSPKRFFPLVRILLHCTLSEPSGPQTARGCSGFSERSDQTQLLILAVAPSPPCLHKLCTDSTLPQKTEMEKLPLRQVLARAIAGCLNGSVDTLCSCSLPATALSITASAKGYTINYPLPQQQHLSVLSELNKLIWSNAFLAFVAEEGPEPVVGEIYTHYILCTTTVTALDFRITPLPTPYLAAIAEHPTRSRVTGVASFDSWFEHLRRVPFKPPLTVCSPLNLIKTEGFPPILEEDAGMEFKLDMELDFNWNSVMGHYLTEPLLNDPSETKRLIIGIEDATRIAVGHVVADYASGELALEFFSSNLPKKIFPTLTADMFTLIIHAMPESDPRTWEEPIYSTPLTSLGGPDSNIMGLLLLARGCAAVSEDKELLFVPDTFYKQLQQNSAAPDCFAKCTGPLAQIRSLWTPLRVARWSTVNPEDVNVELRSIVEISFGPLYAGAFFRTQPVPPPLTSRNAYRLILPPSPSIGPHDVSLDARTIWLRARAGVAFNLALREFLLSPICCKILSADTDHEEDNLKHSLRHCMNGANIDFLRPSDAHPLPPCSRVFLSLLSDSALATLSALRERFDPPWFAVFFVDTSTEPKPLRFPIPQFITVLDERALVPVGVPLPVLVDVGVPELLPSAPPGPPLPQATTFSRIPTTLTYAPGDVLKKDFRAWMERNERDQDPPAWELLQNDLIFFTTQAERLNKAINDCWASRSSHKVIPLAKIFPASGATCLLRTVAYRQFKQGCFVVWISTMSLGCPVAQYAAELRDFARNADGSHPERLVVVTDQCGDHSLWNALNEAFPLSSMVWLRLTAMSAWAWSSSPSAVQNSFIVSPFVGSEDINGLVRSLQIFGNEAALASVAKAAKLSSNLQPPKLEDSHLLVFVLAATRGIYKPLNQWVAEIHHELQTRNSVLNNFAFALSIVYAFSANPKPLVGLDPSKHEPDGFSVLFPCQVERVTRGNGDGPAEYRYTYSCLHPFLARLFLSCSLQLHWNNEYLDWKELCQAWQRALGVLLNSIHLPALKSLLTERGGGLFCPLLIEAFSSSSSLKDQKSSVVDKIQASFLPDSVHDSMGFHHHILLSCLYCCSSQSQSGKRAVLDMELAIKEAEKAEFESRRSSYQGRFTALQNLATMHGAAASLHDHGTSKFLASRGTCHSVLKTLFEEDLREGRRNLRDLVQLGLKWCTEEPHSGFWSQQCQDLGSGVNNEDESIVSVRWLGRISNPLLSRFGLFSERNSGKLTKTESYE